MTRSSGYALNGFPIKQDRSARATGSAPFTTTEKNGKRLASPTGFATWWSCGLRGGGLKIAPSRAAKPAEAHECPSEEYEHTPHQRPLSGSARPRSRRCSSHHERGKQHNEYQEHQRRQMCRIPGHGVLGRSGSPGFSVNSNTGSRLQRDSRKGGGTFCWGCGLN